MRGKAGWFTEAEEVILVNRVCVSSLLPEDYLDTELTFREIAACETIPRRAELTSAPRSASRTSRPAYSTLP